jgi:hypothetical protein
LVPGRLGTRGGAGFLVRFFAKRVLEYDEAGTL